MNVGDDNAARGLLTVALLQQSLSHEKDVKAKGGDFAFLSDWMQKHPDPTKVGDFVENLLCVPSVQVQRLLDAGQPLPDGFAAWRQRCYDTYRATLPIAEWKQLAKHPELVPSVKQLRAAQAGTREYKELADRVRGASFVIGDWMRMGIWNIDIDTKDLYPKGKGIAWELFQSSRSVKALDQRIKASMKELNDPRMLAMSDIEAAHAVRKSLIGAMQEDIAAEAKKASGGEGYARGYSGRVTARRVVNGVLSVLGK